MDLRVMAMKWYSIHQIALELEPHHLIQFSVILKTSSFLFGCYPSAEDTISPADREIEIRMIKNKGKLKDKCCFHFLWKKESRKKKGKYKRLNQHTKGKKEH